MEKEGPERPNCIKENRLGVETSEVFFRTLELHAVSPKPIFAYGAFSASGRRRQLDDDAFWRNFGFFASALPRKFLAFSIEIFFSPLT